jgi:hypothetical protein
MQPRSFGGRGLTLFTFPRLEWIVPTTLTFWNSVEGICKMVDRQDVSSMS